MLCYFWVSYKESRPTSLTSQARVSLQTERPSSSIGTLEGFFFFWFSLLFLWVFSSTSASFFWVSFLCSVLICIWNYPPVFVIGNVHHLNSEIYGQIRVSVCGVVSREYGNPGVWYMVGTACKYWESGILWNMELECRLEKDEILVSGSVHLNWSYVIFAQMFKEWEARYAERRLR